MYSIWSVVHPKIKWSKNFILKDNKEKSFKFISKKNQAFSLKEDYKILQHFSDKYFHFY
jgi:hypothetical protein